MKYPLALALLLHITLLSICAQTQPNYRGYYDTINQAELRVFELNFHEAYNTYKQAFTVFEKRHSNDLHNASLCAIVIGEHVQAKEWIMEMITKGVDINTLNTRYFKKLPEAMWEEIRQSNSSLRAIYLAKVDSNYITILDTLRAREQDYLINRRPKESYDSLIYEHAKVLHALISERGIPPVPIFNRFHLPIDVLLHHFGLRNQLKFPKENGIDLNTEPYSSMEFSQYDLEPLLRHAVFKGDLSPQFLGLAMSHSELDSTRQLGGFYVCADLNTKTITSTSTSEENLKQIDQYRQSIGLESAHDAAKKDIKVTLYYNQDAFPFDEYIRRFREIDYNLKTTKSLGVGTKEFDLLARKTFKVMREIDEPFVKSNNFRVEGKSDKDYINIENKWDLLKEFRFSQSIVNISLTPEYE